MSMKLFRSPKLPSECSERRSISGDRGAKCHFSSAKSRNWSRCSSVRSILNKKLSRNHWFLLLDSRSSVSYCTVRSFSLYRVLHTAASCLGCPTHGVWTQLKIEPLRGSRDGESAYFPSCFQFWLRTWRCSHYIVFRFLRHWYVPGIQIIGKVSKTDVISWRELSKQKRISKRKQSLTMLWIRLQNTSVKMAFTPTTLLEQKKKQCVILMVALNAVDAMVWDAAKTSYSMLAHL